MFRIDHATAVAMMPAPQDAGDPGFFSRGNPGAGQPSTVVTADWANGIQEELMSVLEVAGIEPDKTQFNQLAAAIAAMIADAVGGGGGDVYAVDVGIADAGGYFESSNVEGALQEIGDQLLTLSQGQNRLSEVQEYTTSQSLLAEHANKLLEFNSATPVDYTVSATEFASMQIGQSIHICQAGAGKVTVVPDGVTVKKGASFNRATMEQEAIIVLVKTAEGVARLGGALEAA
jgi:hypothetical protein